MEGVYIIWIPGKSAIRVGQGIVRDRLNAHKNTFEISKYIDAVVSWAAVTVLNRDGIERFLAEELNPLVGDRFPDSQSIPVNFPWE